MIPIEAIIFDIGGVIFRAGEFRLSDKWVAQCSLEAEAFDQAVYFSEWGQPAHNGTISSDEKWRRINEQLHLSEKQLADLKVDYWDGRWDSQLLDYIRTLKPNYRLAILSDATSDARETVKPWVNEDLFETIVFSYEVGVCKPDSRMYDAVLSQLNVRAEAAIFIDDRPKNVKGARAVGMQAIQYTEFAPMKAELEAMLTF